MSAEGSKRGLQEDCTQQERKNIEGTGSRKKGGVLNMFQRKKKKREGLA